MTPKPVPPEVVAAANVILRWNESNSTGTANTSPQSRLRCPNGEVIVVVAGSHAMCLDRWFDDHGQQAAAEFPESGPRA